MPKKKRTRGKIEIMYATRVSNFIERNDITITALAKGVGCSYHTINRWLLKDQSMQLDTLDAIIKYMERYEKG